MDYKDYYKILNISKNASQKEIKRAYKKLARKFHPDVSKESDAEAKFKEVGEAYEVLKDPEKREAYDSLDTNWKADSASAQTPPNWEKDFGFGNGQYTQQGNPQDYSSFFEDLFGGASAQGGWSRTHANARGEDSHAKVMIDIEDAYNGASRSISLQSTEIGTDGRPEVKKRTLNVKIPQGVKQGQHIRLQGQGQKGFGGAESGDLYLEIDFNLHPLYSVKDKDVYIDIPITTSEAVLGASIKIPTPTGAVDMKIPTGSSSGKKMRLKGRGLPAKEAGDFYVTLQIRVADNASDKIKELYQQIAKEQHFNPREAMGV
jgi:curved DNA-binding protein